MPGQSSDSDYRLTGYYAIEWMSNFGSDLAVISAGFDAHVDEISVGTSENQQMCLTSVFYGELCEMLVSRFDKLFFILEGGYNEQAIAESLGHIIRALLGEPTETADYSFADYSLGKIDARTLKVLDELTTYYGVVR